jgi:hypothetical protein
MLNCPAAQATGSNRAFLVNESEVAANSGVTTRGYPAVASPYSLKTVEGNLRTVCVVYHK